MRFGTWVVSSLYRSGSLTAAARELARYKLDLVIVQRVTWDKGGTLRPGDYIFWYGKGNENHELRTGLFVRQRIASAVKRVEFLGNRMSYIVLRGRLCNIIVLNVRAPSEEKCGDSEGSYYEELEQGFGHFSQYHIKILLGDFNAKLGREDILKPTTGNLRLHQDSNGNGVRIVNLAMSKNLVFKSTMFLQ